MMRLLKRQTAVRADSILALGLILPAVAIAGLLLWNDPLVLLLVGGGACAAAVALLLLLRPLIALQVALFFYLFPTGLRPVEAPLAFDVAANGTIVLALCAWLLHAPAQRQPIHWSTVCLFIVLFILWASVTLLWANDLIEGRKALVQYGIGLILLFLVVQQVRTLRAVDGVMRVIGMIGWITVISGVLTVLLTDYHPGERLKVMDMNENILGVILIIMLPGVIWPVVRSSGARRRFYMVLSIVYILCTLILVLLSGSRGSSLSLVIMLLAFWFSKPLRPWGKMGAVLMIGMLTAAPFLLASLEARSTDNTSGNELGGRDILWLAGWHLIQDHPLTGMGVGNGPYGLRPYILELTDHYAKDFELPAHEPFLEVGCDTGLIGMFLYVGILGVALWEFFHSRDRWYMREGVLASYFPLVLVCAVSYLASFIKGGGLENHPTFFLLLALLIIPSQLSHDRALITGSGPINAPARTKTAPSKL
jgi:putative inorganic carbon (HCO3(-)) transporter